MGVLQVLGGLATAGGQAAQGLGVDQQNAVKTLLAQENAKRESDLANVTALLHQSQISKNNAETSKLTSPDQDFAGHVFDNEGNPYIVHKDGTLSPAVVRGTTPPPAPKIAADTGGVVAPASGPGPSVGPTTPPIATGAAPVTPRFGPKPTFQRVAANVDGKPGFVLQDPQGNFLDPATKKPITGNVQPFTQPDKPQVTIQQSADPNEPPKAVVVSTSDPAHPQVSVTDIPGIAKGSAGGSGFGSLSPEVVAGMAQQAADADKTMREYEAKFRAGQASPHVGSTAAGAAAGAHSTGLFAPVTGLISEGANRLLGATDPEYQTYLTAKQRFGNIMGNLMSKRYSEYQGTLDTQLAGLKGGDVGNTLDLMQSYRKDLLDHLPSGRGASGGGGGKPAPGGAQTWKSVLGIP